MQHAGRRAGTPSVRARLGTIGCWTLAVLFYGGIAAGIFYLIYSGIQQGQGSILLLLLGACVVFAVLGALAFVVAALPARLARTRFAGLVDPQNVVGVLSSVAFAVLLAETRGGGVGQPRGFWSVVGYLIAGAILAVMVSVVAGLLAERFFYPKPPPAEGGADPPARLDRAMVFASRVTIIVLAVGWLLVEYIDWGEPDDFEFGLW